MKYTGQCHCGAVQFEVEMDIKDVLACNCSICSKRGHLLAFAPEKHFKLFKGEQSLGDYQFGAKRIHHMFCKVCGIGTFGKGQAPDGMPVRAINVRCLDDVDLSQLPVKHFDGKSL